MISRVDSSTDEPGVGGAMPAGASGGASEPETDSPPASTSGLSGASLPPPVKARRASWIEVRGHRHGPGCGHSHVLEQAREPAPGPAPHDHAHHHHAHPGHAHPGHGFGHGAVQVEGGGWVATLGTISGVVCLIHCVLTPFLLSAVALLPSLGLMAQGNLERYLVGFTLLMAWSSVVLSYRSHRRRLSLYLLMTGTLLSALSQLLPDATFVQTLISLSGTGFLVSSIWVNRAHIRLGPPVSEVPVPVGS